MSLWKMFGIKNQKHSESLGSVETETVQKITATLKELNPKQARFIACFAYILTRVSHADQHFGVEEIKTIEQLLVEEGQLSEKQADIVVQIAKSQSILFSGIENYMVTREFNKIANQDQKVSLLHCLYRISAANQSVSNIEEGAIRQIARELKLHHRDFISARLHFKEHLALLKDKS